MPRPTLADLPTEVVRSILAHLPGRDLARVAQVSRALHAATLHAELWRAACARAGVPASGRGRGVKFWRTCFLLHECRRMNRCPGCLRPYHYQGEVGAVLPMCAFLKGGRALRVVAVKVTGAVAVG